ncbi:hypothetical protein FDECE_2607 [Fusarium decemcellulare]|nr:hypothetical protein FDECE_2607 [Fusarium decemcellulare]
MEVPGGPLIYVTLDELGMDAPPGPKSNYKSLLAAHLGQALGNTGLSTRKIDTHAHVYPDFYRDAVIAAGHTTGPDGSGGPMNWSITMNLEFMQQFNVEKQYLSVSSPGTFLQPNNTEAGVNLTRRMNDFIADLKRQYPNQIGFFASLPLPSIPDALDEIDRAIDELDADGFVFLSNYYGLYHGDPKLAPVYEKLNARKALIFIHPTIPCPVNAPIDITGIQRMPYIAPMANAYPVPLFEYIFDTTRTVVDIILTGTAQKHADLKWIVPHCGSALTGIIDRAIEVTSRVGVNPTSDREFFSYNLKNLTELFQRQFWFDIAGFSMVNQIHAMARLLGADKFLYGSDVPLSPASPSTFIEDINSTLPTLYNNTEIAAIFRENALNLLSK